MSSEAIEKVVQALEAQVALNPALADAHREIGERLTELSSDVIDLHRRLEFVARRAQLLIAMKAVTLTTRCRRCGATFAQEPGPELCGPCWTELGRPERYLETVTTTTTTEGNETA